MNFFCNFETAPVNKVSLIFSSQNHTPLWPLPMLQWLILNCNQTLQVNFLAYYNNLVSQVRDLMRPWNFWNYFSLTNEVCWWNRSHFWWQVLLNCALRPSLIHLYPSPSTSTQLISATTQLSGHPQYLDQNIAGNWAIFPNLDWKIKSYPFSLKISTHGKVEVLISNPDLDFWSSYPKINFWANLGPKIQSCLFCVKIGAHSISRMQIPIPALEFWNSNPKTHFCSNFGRKS